MAEEKLKKLTVSFRRSPDYKIYPATGAWGGPTTDRQILMHITVEHAAIPSYQTFQVDDSGKLDMKNVVDSVSAGEGEREFLCGILLTPDNALRIAEWLKNHAEKIIGGAI